ncbi:MAG: hypothetical protein NTX33_01085 [Propionibacteriales bacterium]|nr:hypothetical protein [Propionibacteriales bacterium]
MTLPLRFLAALAAVLLVLLPTTVTAAPGPADGCGDLALADRDAVAERGQESDDVFVGRIGDITGTTGASDLSTLPGGSETDTSDPTDEPASGVVLQVQVQQVLAGDNRTVGKPVDVQLVPAEAKLDSRLRTGGRYIFFTEGAGRKVFADGCIGFVATPLLEKELLDRATVTQLREFLAAPVRPPAVDLGNPPADADETPDLGRLVAPGGAISLIGVLGLVLISRIGRQRH